MADRSQSDIDDDYEDEVDITSIKPIASIGTNLAY